jgi:hypothetical protein
MSVQNWSPLLVPCRSMDCVQNCSLLYDGERALTPLELNRPSSNDPGFSTNATVRVRIALLDKLLDHSPKTGGSLGAMVQLVG